ncbi:Putative squalene monooxygenase [Tolypocladium paradoxum]|uniref:Squalene monooxygenase n=1 Tax=Tolypocladium paradoxum TaxID=94208 RepID=A0A2S4L6Q7_9HYPO|nr:Putative squalene monooxygenase [Tolypocladium paradoxum]
MGSSSPDENAIRRIVHRHADVIVVGAGIFGAAMAVTLARQSRSVFLLERSLREPDRIVGELLQPGGVQALEKLGLRHCLDDIDSIPVKGYQIFFNGRPVTIPYPLDRSAAAGNLGQRPEGLSFHHGRFVRKLRAAAAEEPNVTVVETEVDGLIKLEGTNQVLGVKSSTGGKQDYFFAPLTIVADGYRSKFRGETSSWKPVSRSRFWALELRDATLPSPCFGHVLLGSFSPVLLYQIGTHETRALINVPEGLTAAKAANGGVSHYMRHHVLPHLPPAVQPAFSESLDNGRLRCMPNSFLPAAANRAPGLLIAGDALNMRHPLTGGGMTVALSDVALLGELLATSNVPNLNDTKQVLRQMATFHWRRKSHSFVINILAQALYSLFAADDYYLEVLRQGCFEYFTRGGACVDGPAGLLGGIIKKPVVLVYHFFAVAFLSIWTFLLSQPSWRLPLSLIECVGVLLKACWVLFPYIGFELAS